MEKKKTTRSAITINDVIELLKQAGDKGLSSLDISKAGYKRSISIICCDLPVYVERVNGKDRWFYADYAKNYTKKKKYILIPCCDTDKTAEFSSLEMVASFTFRKLLQLPI